MTVPLHIDSSVVAGLLSLQAEPHYSLNRETSAIIVKDRTSLVRSELEHGRIDPIKRAQSSQTWQPEHNDRKRHEQTNRDRIRHEEGHHTSEDILNR